MTDSPIIDRSDAQKAARVEQLRAELAAFGYAVIQTRSAPGGFPASTEGRTSMSTTRAKFKCDSITEQMGSKPVPDGKWEPCVMKSVSLSPVYGSGDPKHENTKFWQATPSGRLELGVINLEAAAMFTPGKEYYVDISETDGKG